MIRNILYSLFFHLLIFALIYFNFNFHKIEDSSNKNSITVSFVTKSGDSPNITSQKPLPQKVPEKSPEQAKPEKPVLPKKKDNQKKVKKESKDKKNINDVKTKNTETPKTKKEPLKEAPKSKIEKTEKKEEVKKEPKPLAKKEQKPPIIKEKEQEIKDIENKQADEEEIPDVAANAEVFEESQKLENVDLLAREKFNIQTQIKRCYKKAIHESGKNSKIPVNIHLVIDKDGSIDLELAEIQDYQKYNDPKEIDFHIAVDNVKRALTLCSPIRNLPEDKYDTWHELNLEFSEKMK